MIDTEGAFFAGFFWVKIERTFKIVAATSDSFLKPIAICFQKRGRKTPPIAKQWDGLDRSVIQMAAPSHTQPSCPLFHVATTDCGE